MKFCEMPYNRPNIDELKAKLNTLKETIENAASAKEIISAYSEVCALSEEYSTLGSLAYVRHTINTKDEFYDAENDFFDQVGPTVTDAFQGISKAMVASKFKAELMEHYGKLMFINTEISLRCFSSEIIELSAEENKLQSEYQKLFASAMVEWEGEMLPLPKLTKYKMSADRAVRQKAFLKDAEFFDSHREEFDSLYDRLVKIRNKQARMLGYENYIQMGYDRLGRNCYGPEKVAEFRNQIEKYIVPVVTKLKEAQKTRLGVNELHLYDNAVIFKEGDVSPKGSSEELLAAAINMYKEMSSQTADFITFMSENELYDLLSKDGKAPGGYCTEFPGYKAPFIFSNFNGTSGDVDVLTHEAGHAFAAFVAARKDIIPDYKSPTIEACEVHSMSMEFLTAPWHNAFFGEDTERYQYYHTADALNFIPYGCMVDEFQHIMYENEDLTPDERNEAWLKLEKKYRPHLNLTDLPFYSRGAGWQHQLHVYLYPLYYIDYCMAQTVAFQFFALSLKNWQEAFYKYLAFVDGAGTKTFEELVTTADLQLPYNEGVLEEVAKVITEKLDSFAF
ncbi:MAG: M3 family oligoendopeptidase [Clostridia bacterium]|nr:M3 family oligoendopeptidase [Clostridia bacterium]